MPDKFREQAVDEFDKWSEDYDRPGFFQRHLFIPTEDHIINDLKQTEKSDSAFRLIDIGCGTGKLIRRIAEAFPKATFVGCDVAPGMIRVATEKVSDKERIQFIVAEASQKLGFPDSSFDYVTCCHSFHHYPDQPGALREFARLLKPEGKLFFVDSDINCFWGDCMHRWIIGIYEKLQVKHYKAPKLRELFEENGFQVIRQDRRGKWVPWMMTVAVPKK